MPPASEYVVVGKVLSQQVDPNVLVAYTFAGQVTFGAIMSTTMT